ncbi:ABC transporter substrate-binding protein [Streptomyces sp. NPDC048636]|uniref:ABC transporter substrate-binding protein n=1 Tax=Streptomyces sp. NPDC048636 TaxID=3155762 RepID=UPI003414A091
MSPHSGALLPPRTRPCVHAALAAGVALALAAACANPDDAGSSSPTASAGTKATGPVKRDPALYAMVPADYRKAGRIKVATNAPFPPFEMFAGNNKLTGLEIDLGHALGQRLGVPFEFSQQPFDGLLPGLQAKKYDVLMAGLFDTKKREKTIDFVTYARSGSAVMVAKGNPEDIKTLAGLCGSQAAAQTGAQQIALLEKQSRDCTTSGKKAVVIKTFPQFSDALLALKTGKADTVLGDLPAVRYSAEKDGSVEVVTDPAAPSGYGAEAMGIGLPKDEPTLRDVVRKALAGLMKDGTYRKILDAYGVGHIAVQAPSVNQAGG